MNVVIIDGIVQKDAKLFDQIANFNISAITGRYVCVNNLVKNRFTYIRIIYPKPIDERIESILKPGVLVRIYGKLDSEQYTSKSEKRVYNKIICADKIVAIKYDMNTGEYVEVT